MVNNNHHKYNKDHKKEWLGIIRDINKLEQSINKRKWLLINAGKDNGMITDKELLEMINPIRMAHRRSKAKKLKR